MNIIETRDLRKSFKSRGGKGKPQEVEAVKGVSMKVEKGEIFGFLGPNGAGKTTTLRMLSTLLAPTSGDARVVGYDLLSQAGNIRQQIGYVSQAGGTDQHSSARENLLLQAQLYGLNNQAAHKRAEELIHALQLDGFADRPGKTYSWEDLFRWAASALGFGTGDGTPTATAVLG
jgi:ABC-2 type transport system ATP-binding protein